MLTYLPLDQSVHQIEEAIHPNHLLLQAINFHLDSATSHSQIVMDCSQGCLSSDQIIEVRIVSECSATDP